MRDVRYFADAGADLIVGHHGHIVQPLGDVAGVPVAWSLGNFAFPVKDNLYMQHVPGADVGAVLDVDVGHKPLRPTLRLTGMDAQGRPSLLPDPSPAQSQLQAAAVQMANPEDMRAHWQQTSDIESKRLIADAWWAGRRDGPAAGYRALRHSLRQPMLRACLIGSLSRGWR